MAEKYCVLVDGKLCNDCGECQRCDLDPNKICDNCMKCVNTGADYNAIEIDEIIEDGSDGSGADGGCSRGASSARAAAKWRSDS